MPTVTPTSTNVSATAGETFTASTLFSSADPNSLPILSYQIEDISTGPSQGFWVLNGTALPNGQITTISAAQLSQLSFVAGENSAAPVTDMLEVAASDSASSGAFTTFTVTASQFTPVLNAAPPAGTSADIIMSKGSNGSYEIFDVGNNSILSAGSLGQINPTWQVAGIGHFDGADTADLLMRDSTTGALTVYDVSNNNIVGTASLGQVGLEWQVAGFGDFSSRAGETDMLMRNSNTGAFEVYDIINNTITSAGPMGQVGLEWQVAGFGDFSTQANETDMLMRNSNTGAFELYDIANNTITSAGPMGQVGLEWQVAGFGDFSGNANETDMLMRNSNTGAFELYDIANNTITSAGADGTGGTGMAGGGLR